MEVNYLSVESNMLTMILSVHIESHRKNENVYIQVWLIEYTLIFINKKIIIISILTLNPGNHGYPGDVRVVLK